MRRVTSTFWGELPPRTRRIQIRSGFEDRPLGTTSAYAENTLIRRQYLPDNGNYLRVRGEYCLSCDAHTCVSELPPRTRRIHGWSHGVRFDCGTTSAYAENTLCSFFTSSNIWNYLRVRGEYPAASPTTPPAAELPPRTRRIPHRAMVSALHRGTTSAYAENTLSTPIAAAAPRNYLRVRGEYPK